MAIWLPSVSTLRPTMSPDCSICCDDICAAIAFIVVLSDSMPVTVLICAICVVICALSIGFIGSWLLSWATSSFRKRSWMSAELVLVPVLAALSALELML